MTAVTSPGDHTLAGETIVISAMTPEQLLTVIPYLLGFQPGGSLVATAAKPAGGSRLTYRANLPSLGGREPAGIAGRHVAVILRHWGYTEAAAVGYGPGDVAGPALAELAAAGQAAGMRFTRLLRADAGRYWTYGSPAPVLGIPYDPAPDPALAEALAAAGYPAPLPSRDALAATLAPADGTAAEAMEAATVRASRRAARLVARAGTPAPRRPALVTAGTRAMIAAIRRYRDGGAVTGHDEAAWLTVALRDTWVRDDAWTRMDPAHTRAHQRLWTDLTRRARPGYVAAPATLLAFAAWQTGNGALAAVALDRAQADNPHYSMATLLREAVSTGAPPSKARLPMTPRQVSAAYIAVGAGQDPARL